MIKLGIIIPTFNRKKLLKELLESIREQESISFLYEIIVVVDGSSDGTIEMLNKQFSNVFVVRGTGNWWWTKSVNEGLKVAIGFNCNMFLLMNDDTYIKRNFLEDYVLEYSSCNQGILGAISLTDSVPRKIFYSGIKDIKWNIAKWKKYHPFFFPYSDKIQGVHPTLVVPGRGMIFSKEVIDIIGFFDESHFPQYYADYDFSYRAFKNKFNVNVTWNLPIYSYTKLTAKGSKVNSSFFVFLRGFMNPMASQSIKRTYFFYKFHGGRCYFIGFFLHNLRLLLAYITQKIKKVI